MPNLLSNINNSSTEVSKNKMYRFLTILFVVFLIVGLLVGVFINRFMSPVTDEEVSEQVEEKQEFYEGTVTYLEPFLYPQDSITYILVDARGNDVILLKAKDQKLEVAEGHYVTVYGTEHKTADGKDVYLLVERVVINNVAN